MSPHPLYPSKLIYQLVNFHKSWFDHHANECTIAEGDHRFLLFLRNENILTPHLRINLSLLLLLSVVLCFVNC